MPYSKNPDYKNVNSSSTKPNKTKSKDLTKAQLNKLEKHKKDHGHTTKHINEMKKLMKEGMSFTLAHKKVMKSVGK